MFQQILDPVGGSLAWSALVAAVPLITLFVLLGVFRVKAWQAAVVALALSFVLAFLVWDMPFVQTLSTTGYGALYGVFPILWILVNALWLYKLTVITGWFEVLGDRIRSISDDQRILSILIAFCFGALLESLAGFGAPVAISAAMLMAAGMKPMKSAVVSLLANTAPVAFGAMAAPILALASVTGIDVHVLSQMAGRQTPFVALFVPLILVLLVDGWRGVRETWVIALIAGFTFGLAQFVTANYIAVEITDIVAAVVTVGVVLAVLKVWKPKNELAFEADETASTAALSKASGGSTMTVDKVDTITRSSRRLTWGAVMPYVVIIVIFGISQIPAVKSWLDGHLTTSFAWPGLEIANSEGTAVGTKFKTNHLTGTLLLLSGIVVAIWYKVSAKRALVAFKETLAQLKFTIVTVVAVLALAYVMNFSGQTASLGAALAATGGFFALLSPVIGWVGVAITGSDTSSNALFGALQVKAAMEAGISPVLMAATNSSAGVLGKMLSPQNLAVAAAAVGLNGKEGDIFRRLIGWSLGMLVAFTVLVYLQSTPVLDWMVPETIWTQK